MAHFAKLNQENIVIDVIKVNNNELLDNGIESEQKGINFLKSIFGQDTIWKKTSYNTVAGIYYTPNPDLSILGMIPDSDQSKAFRGWYPYIGYTYDSINDRFIPAKVFENSKFNEEYLIWEPLVDYPNVTTYGDGTSEYLIEFNYQPNKYIGTDELLNKFEWVPETSSWVSTAN